MKDLLFRRKRTHDGIELFYHRQGHGGVWVWDQANTLWHKVSLFDVAISNWDVVVSPMTALDFLISTGLDYYDNLPPSSVEVSRK